MYQVARGTQDFYGLEIKKWHALEDIIRQLCTVYGYEEIRTPMFEHTEVFKRGNDSSDMVNKEMYTFADNGGRSLTLRPEGTASIVRSFVENKHYGSPELPLKQYYVGPMFRYERPQKGRYRQFSQFGVECIGATSALLDAETIALGCSVVAALGITDIKIHVNTLGDDESRARYRDVLKEHFAPYVATLCHDCQRRFEQNPLRLLDCKVDHDHAAMHGVPKMSDYLNDASAMYFAQVLEALDALGIDYVVDDALVRGLDYYTHTVFEAISTNSSTGAQATAFAGGRYDGLVEYFGGPAMSGVGFAAGMERLILYAEAEGNVLAKVEPIDCYVMPLHADAQVPALQIVTELRAAGYCTTMDYLGRSFKAQFKSVDRLQAKLAVLLGEDELSTGVVTIKDIKHQKQEQVPMADIVSAVDGLLQDEDCGCGDAGCTCHHEEHQHKGE